MRGHYSAAPVSPMSDLRLTAVRSSSPLRTKRTRSAAEGALGASAKAAKRSRSASVKEPLPSLAMRLRLYAKAAWRHTGARGAERGQRWHRGGAVVAVRGEGMGGGRTGEGRGGWRGVGKGWGHEHGERSARERHCTLRRRRTSHSFDSTAMLGMLRKCARANSATLCSSGSAATRASR